MFLNRLGLLTGLARSVALEVPNKLVVVGAHVARAGKSLLLFLSGLLLEPLDLLLLGLVLAPLPQHLLFFSHQVIGIPAARDVERSGVPVDLEDLPHNPVEKEPVVGDDDARSVAPHEKIFQPDDSRQVEVVRRLVKKQDVGVGEKHSRHEHLALLARLERVDRPVAGNIGESEAGEHHVQSMIERVAVPTLVLNHCLFRLLHPPFQISHAGNPAHVVADGLVRTRLVSCGM